MAAAPATANFLSSGHAQTLAAGWVKITDEFAAMSNTLEARVWDRMHDIGASPGGARRQRFIEKHTAEIRERCAIDTEFDAIFASAFANLPDQPDGARDALYRRAKRALLPGSSDTESVALTGAAALSDAEITSKIDAAIARLIERCLASIGSLFDECDADVDALLAQAEGARGDDKTLSMLLVAMNDAALQQQEEEELRALEEQRRKLELIRRKRNLQSRLQMQAIDRSIYVDDDDVGAAISTPNVATPAANDAMDVDEPSSVYIGGLDGEDDEEEDIEPTVRIVDASGPVAPPADHPVCRPRAPLRRANAMVAADMRGAADEDDEAHIPEHSTPRDDAAANPMTPHAASPIDEHSDISPVKPRAAPRAPATARPAASATPATKAAAATSMPPVGSISDRATDQVVRERFEPASAAVRAQRPPTPVPRIAAPSVILAAQDDAVIQRAVAPSPGDAMDVDNTDDNVNGTGASQSESASRPRKKSRTGGAKKSGKSAAAFEAAKREVAWQYEPRRFHQGDVSLGWHGADKHFFLRSDALLDLGDAVDRVDDSAYAKVTQFLDLLQHSNLELHDNTMPKEQVIMTIKNMHDETERAAFFNALWVTARCVIAVDDRNAANAPADVESATTRTAKLAFRLQWHLVGRCKLFSIVSVELADGSKEDQLVPCGLTNNILRNFIKQYNSCPGTTVPSSPWGSICETFFALRHLRGGAPVLSRVLFDEEDEHYVAWLREQRESAVVQRCWQFVAAFTRALIERSDDTTPVLHNKKARGGGRTAQKRPRAPDADDADLPPRKRARPAAVADPSTPRVNTTSDTSEPVDVEEAICDICSTKFSTLHDLAVHRELHDTRDGAPPPRAESGANADPPALRRPAYALAGKAPRASYAGKRIPTDTSSSRALLYETAPAAPLAGGTARRNSFDHANIGVLSDDYVPDLHLDFGLTSPNASIEYLTERVPRTDRTMSQDDALAAAAERTRAHEIGAREPHRVPMTPHPPSPGYALFDQDDSANDDEAAAAMDILDA